MIIEDNMADTPFIIKYLSDFTSVEKDLNAFYAKNKTVIDQVGNSMDDITKRAIAVTNAQKAIAKGYADSAKEADKLAQAASKAAQAAASAPTRPTVTATANPLANLNAQIATGLTPELAKATAILDTIPGKIKNVKIDGKIFQGQEIATQFRTATGAINTFTRTLVTTQKATKDVGAQVVVMNSSLTPKPNPWRTAGADIAELGRRAILTVPIWTALRAVWTGMLGAISGGFKFLVDWEKQMAQIKVTSGASAAELASLSTSLLAVAKNFAISNEAVGSAAVLWLQQGRAISEIIPLMNATAKLSLLTGEDTAKSVESLTAVLKAYSVEAKDAINVIDAITNVELVHAVTTRDLVNAYKVVGSSAAQLGIDLDTLTGFITAIKSETRDTGAVVGRVLRTAFSRLATDQAKNVQSLTGVSLFLDEFGKATTRVTPTLRPLGESINEVALRFNDLGNAEQAQLAKLIGGVRNQNQIIALFKNYKEAIVATNDSLFAFGKANTATNILLETTAAKMTKAGAAWNQFIATVTNTTLIRGTIDQFAKLLDISAQVINPQAAQVNKTQKAVSDQNDEYSRQIKLIENIQNRAAQAKSLEDILSRNPGKIADIEFQVEQIISGINSVSSITGISVDDKIKSPTELVKALDSVKTSLDEITRKAKDGQIAANLSRDIAAAGGILTNAVNATNIFSGFGSSFGDIPALTRISKSLKNLRLGISLDSNSLQKLEADIKSVVSPEQFKEIKKEINNIVTAQERSKLATAGITEEQQKLNEAVAQEQQIRSEKVAEAVLGAEIERLKLLGASQSQLLKLKIAAEQSLKINQDEISQLKQKLDLENQILAEKQKQRQVSSEAEKLVEIAKTTDRGTADAIARVLRGNAKLSNFNDEVRAVADKFFPELGKQEDAKEFLKYAPSLQISAEDRAIVSGKFNVEQSVAQIQQLVAAAEAARQPSIPTAPVVNNTINVNGEVILDQDKVGKFAVKAVKNEVKIPGTELRKEITNSTVIDAGLQ